MLLQVSAFAGENPEASTVHKKRRANSDLGSLEEMPSLTTERRIFKVRRVDRPNFMAPLLMPYSSEEHIDVPLNQLSIRGDVLVSGEEKDDT